MDGLIVDALIVGSIALFAWAGLQLGAKATLVRAIAALVAFVVCVPLRDPMGDVVHSLFGASDDASRLIGMIVVAVATFVAVIRLCYWWLGRREARRADAGFDELDADPLDRPVVAMLSGGFIGLLWAVFFAAMLVLIPADNVVSRGAIRSFSGGLLIKEGHVLRWIGTGFPHYTQTLPKGKLGAVVGARDELPMRGDIKPTIRHRDADLLLRSINETRHASDARQLIFNPDVAQLAERQAATLAADKVLRTTSPTGGSLDARVQAALGESAPQYESDAAVIVVWAHSSANAGNALVVSNTTEQQITQTQWTEIGIGVADAGWFNGKIFVIILIAGRDIEGETGAAAAAGSTEQTDTADDSQDAVSSDTSDSSGGLTPEEQQAAIDQAAADPTNTDPNDVSNALD